MADDGQAQFDAAFAQAAVKQPKVIDPGAPLPHYPQRRYVEKNLAPELNLSYGDVAELAEARRLAEATGVLPREVAEHMLPMAMVEGRQGNYGINEGNAFRATPAALERAKKLGLAVADMTDPAVAEKHKFDFHEDRTDEAGFPQRSYYRKITVQGPDGPMEAHQVVEGPPTTPLTIDYPLKKQPKGQMSPAQALVASGDTLERIPGNRHIMVQGRAGSMGKLMALILAEKHGVAKGDIAGAVKGYNGSGPATEKYWAKVQAAKQLLLHPKNAPLMAYYNSQYLKKAPK
jgi:hypothetical protein